MYCNAINWMVFTSALMAPQAFAADVTSSPTSPQAATAGTYLFGLSVEKQTAWFDVFSEPKTLVKLKVRAEVGNPAAAEDTRTKSVYWNIEGVENVEDGTTETRTISSDVTTGHFIWLNPVEPPKGLTGVPTQVHFTLSVPTDGTTEQYVSSSTVIRFLHTFTPGQPYETSFTVADRSLRQTSLQQNKHYFSCT